MRGMRFLDEMGTEKAADEMAPHDDTNCCRSLHSAHMHSPFPAELSQHLSFM